jgi:hypothetical protein
MFSALGREKSEKFPFVFSKLSALGDLLKMGDMKFGNCGELRHRILVPNILAY